MENKRLRVEGVVWYVWMITTCIWRSDKLFIGIIITHVLVCIIWCHGVSYCHEMSSSINTQFWGHLGSILESILGSILSCYKSLKNSDFGGRFWGVFERYAIRSKSVKNGARTKKQGLRCRSQGSLSKLRGQKMRLSQNLRYKKQLFLPNISWKYRLNKWRLTKISSKSE